MAGAEFPAAGGAIAGCGADATGAADPAPEG